MVIGVQKLCNCYQIYELTNLIKDSSRKIDVKIFINHHFFGETRHELTIVLHNSYIHDVKI